MSFLLKCVITNVKYKILFCRWYAVKNGAVHAVIMGYVVMRRRDKRRIIILSPKGLFKGAMVKKKTRSWNEKEMRWGTNLGGCWGEESAHLCEWRQRPGSPQLQSSKVLAGPVAPLTLQTARPSTSPAQPCNQNWTVQLTN